MITRFEKFSFAISEISKYWHQIASNEMRNLGLKGAISVYLTTLYRFEDGITSVELAELCCRDKSDVSRALKTLQDKGYVQKKSDKNNLYRAKIFLTESGKKIAEQVNLKVESAVKYAGKDLSDSDRKIFYQCLDSLIANFQKLSKRKSLKEEINND